MKTLDFWKDRLKEVLVERTDLSSKLRRRDYMPVTITVRNKVRSKLVSRRGQAGLFRSYRRIKHYWPEHVPLFKTSRSRAKKNFRRKTDLYFRAQVKELTRINRLLKKLSSREAYFRERIRVLESQTVWDTIRKGGMPL